MPHATPTETDARDAVRRLLGVEASHVARFPTGTRHHVYHVALTDGRRVVARMSLPEDREVVRGAIGWHRLLRQRGVPLPELLASAVEPEDGPFPTMILERLPGTDLQHVYVSLTGDERRMIATEVAAVQRIVGDLPPRSRLRLRRVARRPRPAPDVGSGARREPRPKPGADRRRGCRRPRPRRPGRAAGGAAASRA